MCSRLVSICIRVVLLLLLLFFISVSLLVCSWKCSGLNMGLFWCRKCKVCVLSRGRWVVVICIIVCNGWWFCLCGDLLLCVL